MRKTTIALILCLTLLGGCAPALQFAGAAKDYFGDKVIGLVNDYCLRDASTRHFLRGYVNKAFNKNAAIAISCAKDDDFEDFYASNVAEYVETDYKAYVLNYLFENGHIDLGDGKRARVIIEDIPAAE